MAKWNEQQNEIKNYIEKTLIRKLKKDQRELKILSEGDLQSCVYYHLRKKLKKMLKNLSFEFLIFTILTILRHQIVELFNI